MKLWLGSPGATSDTKWLESGAESEPVHTSEEKAPRSQQGAGKMKHTCARNTPQKLHMTAAGARRGQALFPAWCLHTPFLAGAFHLSDPEPAGGHPTLTGLEVMLVSLWSHHIHVSVPHRV